MHHSSLGAVPTGTIMFSFFFSLSTWTRKKSSCSNSIRLHSHSHHYNLQKTSYYSSSFICCAGAFGSFWLKWQPASVSRATKRKKIREKNGAKRIRFIQNVKAHTLVWTSRCETKSMLFCTVYLRFNTLKSSQLNLITYMEHKSPQWYQTGMKKEVLS